MFEDLKDISLSLLQMILNKKLSAKETYIKYGNL